MERKLLMPVQVDKCIVRWILEHIIVYIPGQSHWSKKDFVNRTGPLVKPNDALLMFVFLNMPRFFLSQPR